jgi:galactokinase
MERDIAALRRQFSQVFGEGGKIHIVRAPGRVNLIGEHTDYNDGFVFPVAVDREVLVVFRGRDDGKLHFASTAFPGEIDEVGIDGRIPPRPNHWSNYARGIASNFQGAGVTLVGMDALVINTLPVGSGLSSSAALLISTALSMLALTGLKMDPTRIAMLAHKAENDFVGLPCGIMDQTIVATGRPGFAMLLDCRDLSRSYVALDPKELRIVIANTMVSHSLPGGEYEKRRKDCEEAVAFFKKTHPAVKALRDVTIEMINHARGKLADRPFMRARHVVSEIARTQEAAELLGRRRYEEVGQLMLKSHESLKRDYEVSSPELDCLVEESMKVKGVYGARLTGAGLGGCIVSLVQPRAVDAMTKQIQQAYKDRFGKTPEVYVSNASAGASVIE